MPEGGNWKDLFKAAQEGDRVTAKYHLDGGVDTNYQHPEYMTTPLLEAVREGHFPIVKMLVEEGKADPTVVEEMTDDTALDLALELQQFDMVEYLYSKLTPTQQRAYPQYERHHILVIGGTDIGRRAITDICQSFLAKGHCVLFTWDNSDQETAAAIQAQLEKSTGSSYVKYLLGSLDSVENANAMVDTIHQTFPAVDTVVHHLLIPPENSLSAMYALHKGILPLLEQQHRGKQSRLIVVLPMEPIPSHRESMAEPLPDFQQFAGHRFSTKLSCCILSFLHFLNLCIKANAIAVTLLQQQQEPLPKTEKVAEAYQQTTIYGRCIAYFRRMILENAYLRSTTTFPASKYYSNSPAQALVWLLSHPHYPDDQTCHSLPFITKPLLQNNWEQWTMNVVSRSKSQPPTITRENSIFPIIVAEDA